mmetsp:Transcript_69626/g.203787  ORF Transcript_69626/g.203787 Transcript_69626/m.203787 type:complete len:120 (-) Transcript_69626:529-888(-)
MHPQSPHQLPSLHGTGTSASSSSSLAVRYQSSTSSSVQVASAISTAGWSGKLERETGKSGSALVASLQLTAMDCKAGVPPVRSTSPDCARQATQLQCRERRARVTIQRRAAAHISGNRE